MLCQRRADLAWPPNLCGPPPSETHKDGGVRIGPPVRAGFTTQPFFQAARVPPPLLFVTACWLTRGDIFMKWVIITVINWILHWVTSRFTKNVPYSHISPPHQPPRAKISPLCKYGDLYHLYLGTIVPRSSPTTPYTVTEGVFQVAAYYNSQVSNKYKEH